MAANYRAINYETLLQTFLGETREQLLEMEADLISLEGKPVNKENLDNIFRLAHTIKGSSACIELNSVAHFAHAFEDVLTGVRDQSVPVTSKSITLLLQAVDCLRQVIACAASGDDRILPEYEALLARISAMENDQPGRRAAEQATSAARESAAPDEAGSPAPRHATEIKTLRVASSKLDRMLNLTGEISIARGRLKQLLESHGLQRDEQTSRTLESTDGLFVELQELIMKSRMVPLGTVFRQYIRTVRDLAESTGKSVRLSIAGEESEVDTSVVEHLKDPLTHIIRNAVDHGIERPDIRIQKGKDPCGNINVRAYQQGGSIVIRIADDGAGLNDDRILEQALLKGIISDSACLTGSEIHRLILQPGFSTAETVTEISGRGVGMDVVRRNIEAVNGSVEVESVPSEGTTIILKLPLTLAIIEGFIVGVGDESYVIPMSNVTECLDLTDADKTHSMPGGLINLRGEAVPYLRLRTLFEVPGEAPERESLILVKHRTGHAGFAVDTLLGEGDVVIKPLGKLFKRLPGVSGSTILGTGRVALVLDIPALIRESAGLQRLM